MRFTRVSILLFSLLFVAACGGGGGGDDGPQNNGRDITEGGDSFCLDSCQFAGDGECDDTGPGAITGACVLGTDCSDCGSRPAPAPGAGGLSCSDDCVFAGDGECDDGRDPNFALVCPPATDCTDCGPENLIASFPGAFGRSGAPSFESWFDSGAPVSDKLESK